MIKINLLGEAPQAVAVQEPEARAQPSMNLALVFGASFVVCLAIVALLGWIWGRQVDRLERELKVERAEQARLSAVASENQRYEQEIHQLEIRTQTIETLEKSRTGPVELLNALANTVNRASDLYLLSVKADGGRLVLKGQSASVHSIADFIAALKQEGSFHEVHLQQYYQDDESEQVIFKFDLDCVYGSGVAPAPAPAATAARGGKA